MTAPLTASGGELSDIADELLAALGAVRRSVGRSTVAGVALPGLPGAQVDLLRLVHRRPGIGVAEAAAELHLAANTVSTLVGHLVEAGLLRRTPGQEDRRVATLTLTLDARQRIDAWLDRRAATLAAGLASLPAMERRRLAAAISALHRLADAMAPRGESG